MTRELQVAVGEKCFDLLEKCTQTNELLDGSLNKTNKMQ